jgi:hypothetical protein
LKNKPSGSAAAAISFQLIQKLPQRSARFHMLSVPKNTIAGQVSPV